MDEKKTPRGPRSLSPRVFTLEEMDTTDQLNEAALHITRASDWIRWGIDDKVSAEFAAHACLLHLARSIELMIDAPPFTTAA